MFMYMCMHCCPEHGERHIQTKKSVVLLKTTNLSLYLLCCLFVCIEGSRSVCPQVTLMGQSACDQSTLIHLLWNESTPLFHQAVVMSAPHAIPERSMVRPIALQRVRYGGTVQHTWLSWLFACFLWSNLFCAKVDAVHIHLSHRLDTF